jgi:predicted  nucleic acid-binding Zn-ribbon protein
MSTKKLTACVKCQTIFDCVPSVTGTLPEHCPGCGVRYRRVSSRSESIDYVYGNGRHITSVSWYEWDPDENLHDRVLEDLTELSKEVVPGHYELGEVFDQGNGHFWAEVTCIQST